ncbi:MAG: hypothetical protein R6X33_09230 [Candidatus Brocadiia bacterium]
MFVERDMDLAEALRCSGGYTVRLVGRERRRTRVRHYNVLSTEGTHQLRRAAERCHFAATAVGGQNLPAVAQLLAPALARRRTVLNVLVCENWPHADSVLRGHLEREGADDFRCVPASVERMVRPAPDGLDLVGEAGQSLYFDASKWAGEPPSIPGFTACGDIDFYYARKLFTNNAGHAALAYEGHLAGYELLCDAHGDPAIRARVATLLEPAAEMLARQFGADRGALREHVAALLERRFPNRELADRVRRAARDPLRKLGADERLVGLLRRLQKHDLPVRPVCRTIACAMHYRDPEDAECAQMFNLLRRGGPELVLTQVCRLRPAEEAYGECLRQCELIEAYTASGTGDLSI